MNEMENKKQSFPTRKRKKSTNSPLSPKRFKYDDIPKDKYKEFVNGNKRFFERLKQEDIKELAKKKAFGNYKRDRSVQIMQPWKDLRAGFFNPNWIRDKTCLDIGSGEGLLTIILAIKYKPKFMVGCDIDSKLVNKAISHLHSLKDKKELIQEINAPLEANSDRSEKRKELIKKLKTLPKSFTIGLPFQREYLLLEAFEESNNEEHLAFNTSLNTIKTYDLNHNPQEEIEDNILLNQMSNIDITITKQSYENTTEVADSTLKEEELKYKTDVKGDNLLDNIVFRQENYIADIETSEKFDTILCMNTSKWIHLAYGDTGIKALFYKVYKSLNHNGIFIFEPQPWSSYTKRKDKDQRYKDIAFLPSRFEPFLNEIGFKLLEKVIPELPAKNRPILILQK